METSARAPRQPGFAVPASALLFLLAAVASAHPVFAQTTITAYQATIPVNVNQAYSPSQWSDTPQIYEPDSQMTVAFKQNGTGLLFLMRWATSTVCTDSACFGGIEFGHLNNTQPMGSSTTPTIMILASTSFKGNVDEFISEGEETPESVEAAGYTTQSVCGLTLAGNQYTVECYRPFALHNASPYDFDLAVGSTVEIGFSVGEFTNPGEHNASDMSTYVLTISNQTYTAPSTTSSSSTPSTTLVSSTSSSLSLSSSASQSISSSTAAESSTSTTTTSTSASSISSMVSAVPTTASTYAEELLVLTIGFAVLILVALTKYERS